MSKVFGLLKNKYFLARLNIGSIEVLRGQVSSVAIIRSMVPLVWFSFFLFSFFFFLIVPRYVEWEMLLRFWSS